MDANETMEEKGKDPHVKTVVDEGLEPLAMSVFGVESTFRNLRYSYLWVLV